jgi:carbamoyltransferase
MKIIGISAYYHDSSAALVVDGHIVAAAQEERFTRKKHDSCFPKKSIEFCLQQGGLLPNQIDAVVFYEKPFIKFERLLETYVHFAPRGFSSFVKAIPLWLTEKLFQKHLLSRELSELGFTRIQTKNILFSEHHLSHAASAFYPSAREEAIILTMDGVGEWDTTTIYHGQGNSLTKLKEIHFPHSLGLLYSAFTYHCGFKVNSGEYKLMGLAPYGKPLFAKKIRDHLIQIADDGSYQINQDYFDYCIGLKMTNSKFNRLFESSFRKPTDPLLQVHMDLAASIQEVTEEVILKICANIAKTYGIKNLCLAGGVSLNCVANGKLHASKLFDSIWIQPAAGDAGGALGSALAAYYLHFKNNRILVYPDSMNNGSLGPDFCDQQIEEVLNQERAVYKKLEASELFQVVTEDLIKQKAIGWFQGRMEFGPRALGNRSIIADPRSIEMQKTLNLKVKFRESFRPFAPVVLREDVAKWFDFDTESPYMLMVAPVKEEHCFEVTATNMKKFGIDLLNVPRSKIAAITHVDSSARLQTVCEESNPRLYSLMKLFKEKTGVGVLVNTSFNVRGEPIVCSIQDAYRCFMGTDLDVLVIENYVLYKTEQVQTAQKNYVSSFELD